MKPASFSLLTGRPKIPSAKASNEPVSIADDPEDQEPEDNKAETTACLQALKEQLDGLATALTARMDTMEATMKAIADKPVPTISAPPSEPPTINIPAMPSYKKEFEQISTALGVLIARNPLPAKRAAPSEISFDVQKNGLGEVVAVIARRTQ
jgi:hypothetical protein